MNSGQSPMTLNRYYPGDLVKMLDLIKSSQKRTAIGLVISADDRTLQRVNVLWSPTLKVTQWFSDNLVLLVRDGCKL